MSSKGFTAYETISISLPNQDYGGYDPQTARRLIREGKGQWAWLQGGVLAFVPNNYKLKMWENFLRETPMGFEVDDAS
jgi:hypothetical protein